MMKSNELRRSFLNFFSAKGHTIVPTMSLIPKDDPSLLFTSAGMVQFKPLWTGAVALPYKRAASVQKCLRLSDLNQVGRTRRHHTFFEMLGNFSFGDYFKEEAIVWAWEYLTDVLSIDKSKLYVSVHIDDEESYNIWLKKIRLKPERLFKLGDDNNFWGPAGNSGPCGPCSEIFFDLGPKFSCGRKGCAPGCDCDRYPEVWNLVFPQFNQTVNGERLPLKNRGVDTGMGLERLLSILQKKDSNFHTDLFFSIIKEITGIARLEYGKDQETDVNINVIADHIRALIFAIADGVIPSNEERGYVVRRILRRAVRLCRNLGIEGPFLYRLVPGVVAHYQEPYPELLERREEISLVIKSEEERFLATLERGLLQFEEILKQGKEISGKLAFKLYDTYGFPIELTKEIAKEKGIRVDEEGFKRSLEQARERSKTRAKFTPKGEWQIIVGGDGKFVGYEKDEVETEILRFNEYDNKIEVVLEKSPFYAEAGGQVGEQGELLGEGFKIKVLDTYWFQGMRVCHGEVIQGKFTPGKVRARVDINHRKESARAHTATHLLHSALRRVLGEHARQEGSFVEPGRFRFDFIHFNPLSDDEAKAIEDLVIEQILNDLPVEKFYTTLPTAKKMGAMAIFGEKYGEKVRVVRIGDFSIELCGGIHLDRTGEIGMFKIINHGSAAAGIRRVEVMVGKRLFEEVRKNMGLTKEFGRILGTDKGLIKRLDEWQKRIRELEQMNQKCRAYLARRDAEQILRIVEKGDVKVIIKRFDYDRDTMRMIADIIRAKKDDCIGLLYRIVNKKVDYLVFVGEKQKVAYPADRFIKALSKILGGGGGGKSHLAEGGGGKIENLSGVISYLREKFGTEKVVVEIDA